MLRRVVLPLLETGGALAGRLVRPTLNLFCDGLEWCARRTRT